MSVAALVSTEASLRRELQSRLAAGADLPDAARLGIAPAELRAALEGPTATPTLSTWLITRFMRPAIPIAGDVVGEPDSRVWHRRLSVAGRELTRAARAVGRIELTGHPGLSWAGTCWLVSGNAAVTTGGVAGRFCRFVQGKPVLGPIAGFTVQAAVRFDGLAPIAIRKVLIADATAPGRELAFLILDAAAGGREPVTLAMGAPAVGAQVAALGFAAADSRGGSAISEILYRDGINRKCAAPGRLTAHVAGARLVHDCATAGDWGGALLLDLQTGQALGVHVAGALESPGFGVAAIDVAAAMRSLALEVPAPAHELSEEELFEGRRRTAEDYADREGYRSDFIGIDVPAPTPLPAIRDDVAAFDADGTATTLLPYTHFSTCMSRSRRMCFFTACNVHGGKLQDLARSGIIWRFDPRIDEELQAGNDLYVDNDLDRGHMVRRLDPVWGSAADAANGDTFHYTNSCPQHKDLNQKIWNDLENYVLDNAGKHELKINVFTGPVFRPDDMEYRGFRIPAEFWKVVVMVKDDGALSATAYLLSQADMITGLEFVFGEFRTYQVRVRDIEEWTKLDFGDLRNRDPKDVEEGAGQPVLIEGSRDITL